MDAAPSPSCRSGTAVYRPRQPQSTPLYNLLDARYEAVKGIQAAWQTVCQMIATAAGQDIRPGMVAVGQTFGSKINFHPHVHAIVSRGGWTKTGEWIAVPYGDATAAELLLRHKVLSLLRKAGVINEERIALLLSWKHSGFSVHNVVSVEPEDPGAAERLVR